MNFYKILGVAVDATTEEIRVAYLNKQENYELCSGLDATRIAYEILTDDRVRAEYDTKVLAVSEVNEALNCTLDRIDRGFMKDGINDFERIVKAYPDIQLIKVFLADAYLYNDQLGKAIKVMESVVADENPHVKYVAKLIQLYRRRGWRKKAFTEIKKYITDQPNNIELQLQLVSIYIDERQVTSALQVLDKMESMAEYQKYAAEIDYYKIISYIEPSEDGASNNNQKAIDFIEEVYKKACKNEQSREEYTGAFIALAEWCNQIGKETIATIILEYILKLAPKYKEQEINMLVDMLKVKGLIEKLEEDDRFSEELLEYIVLDMMPDTALEMSEQEKEHTNIAAKAMIAENYSKLGSEIKLLKKDYPEIYNKHQAFFENLSKFKFRKKCIQAGYKLMETMDLFSSFFEQLEGEDFYDESLFMMPPQEMNKTVIELEKHRAKRNKKGH